MDIEETRKQIRIKLAELDMQKRQLAEKLGCHPQALTHAMRLRNNPKSIDLLKRACDILGEIAT